MNIQMDDLMGKIQDVLNDEESIRITSYNVCYTKLLRFVHFFDLQALNQV